MLDMDTARRNMTNNLLILVRENQAVAKRNTIQARINVAVAIMNGLLAFINISLIIINSGAHK